MSNHRSVHLNSGLLPLPLPLPFPFFPFALLSSSLPCLARQCLGTNERRKKKPSKARISLLCWQHEKNLFLHTCTLPYLTQTIYQNSETHERAGHE